MWTAATWGGIGIAAMLLLYFGVRGLFRLIWRESKEEGREEARRDTMELDTKVIEEQRDEGVNRPDPHHPDDVLDRL